MAATRVIGKLRERRQGIKTCGVLSPTAFYQFYFSLEINSGFSTGHLSSALFLSCSTTIRQASHSTLSSHCPTLCGLAQARALLIDGATFGG